jgi:hypothetical protein
LLLYVVTGIGKNTMKLIKLMLLTFAFTFWQASFAFSQYLNDLGSVFYAGPTYAIQNRDNLAFLAGGQTFQIVSLDSVRSPVLLSGHNLPMSSSYLNTFSALDFAISGNYVYISGGEHTALIVLSLENLQNPIETGILNSIGYHNNIAISGQYAYLGQVDMYSNLKVVDISNPENPSIVATQSSLAINDLLAVGNYLYSACALGLCLYDISTPESPTISGPFGVRNEAYGLCREENYLFITGSNFLEIFDISDPAQPDSICSIQTGGDFNSIAVDGNLICLASAGAYRTFDVSDKTNPLQLHYYYSQNHTRAIALADSVIIGCGYPKGFEIVDTSASFGTRIISDFYAPFEVYNIVADNNRIIIADSSLGIYLLGTTDIPGRYRHLDRIPSSGFKPLALRDNLLFTGRGEEYLYYLSIYNYAISDTFVNVGNCPFDDFIKDIALSDNYAYVTTESSGLKIVDISNTAHPSIIAQYTSSPGSAKGIAIRDTLAYIGYYYFQILNIADPLHPALISQLTSIYNINDIQINGNYAYLGIPGAGFYIIDISDPTLPVQLGGYYSGHASGSLYLDGNYVYLPDGASGVHVVDVSDPNVPVRSSIFNTPGLAMEVVAYGENLLLADYSSLRILNSTSEDIEVDSPLLPVAEKLLSAYPNPFNSATTITLTGAEQSEIGIYDITGRLITTLYTVGGQAVWDASVYSSGLYFARAAGEKANTIKLVLVK